MACPTKPVETSEWLYHQFAKYPTDNADLVEIRSRQNRNKNSYSILSRTPLKWSQMNKELQSRRSIATKFEEGYLELLCDFHNRRTNISGAVPRYLVVPQGFVDGTRQTCSSWDVPGMRAISRNTRHLVVNRSMPAGFKKRQISDSLDSIEHIFLPFLRFQNGARLAEVRGNHSVMIVVSPNNKTIEYFDSLQLENYEYYLSGVLDWLIYEYSVKCFNATGEGNFDISEWYWRANKCHNQAALANDNYSLDCVVHTCINAYNIAFGHGTTPEENPITQDEVMFKRTRMLVELCNEKLSIERFHGDVASVPLQDNKYLGRKIKDGQWKRGDKNYELDRDTGHRVPHGPGWSKLTWFDKCKWADISGREVRGVGFEYTMVRQGKSSRSTPGAIFNIAVENDRRVLRDIIEELEIPEAAQMVNNTRGPTRWTCAMIQQRIDYQRMQKENYYHRQWTLIKERGEKQPKPPRRAPVYPLTPVVSPSKQLDAQNQTETEGWPTPAATTPRLGDVAHYAINLNTTPPPPRSSTPPAPRRNPTTAPPGIQRPGRPQTHAQRALTPPSANSWLRTAPPYPFSDNSPDPSPTRQPRQRASRAVTPPLSRPKKRPRSVFEEIGETIVNSAIFNAISPIQKKRPKPNPPARVSRAAAAKAAARIKKQSAWPRQLDAVEEEEEEDDEEEEI